jgi:predicted nucleotidyltransferase
MTKHGLTPNQIESIAAILRPYAEKIKIVGLFGSRAKGTYRANSDIDLAIDGELSEEELERIYTLFDESQLPFKIDVNVLALIDYQPLKEHIKTAFHPLLTQDDLRKNF